MGVYDLCVNLCTESTSFVLSFYTSLYAWGKRIRGDAGD